MNTLNVCHDAMNGGVSLLNCQTTVTEPEQTGESGGLPGEIIDGWLAETDGDGDGLSKMDQIPAGFDLVL